jgi:hypothetical protein
VPEARLVVPAHGGIRLFLDRQLDYRQLRVHVEPVSPGGTTLRFIDGRISYHGTSSIPALLSGDYVISFERATDPECRTWSPLGTPTPVTVRGGATTIVYVGR